MHIIRNIRSCPSEAEGAVLALGNFDGIHRGHVAVIKEAVARAKQLSVPAGVMTFEPHPRRVFNPALPPLRIVPFHVKARLIAELGIDVLWVVHFTKAFSQTTAEHFVRGILHETLKVRQVVTGGDFIFGHQRQGNSAYLAEMAETLGFAYTQLAPVECGGAPCSSTRIRAALEKGDVSEAEAILGRPYEVSGRVLHGDKRGRTIGFPTANLVPYHLFLPIKGVYAVRMAVGGNPWEATRWQRGVANLGVRPTFGGTHLMFEAHALEGSGDWYGQRMRVQLVEFLREEMTFAGVDALKQQIARDCDTALQILEKRHAHAV